MSSWFLLYCQKLRISSPKVSLWTFTKAFFKKKLYLKSCLRNQKNKLCFISIFNGLNFSKSLMLTCHCNDTLKCGFSLMPIPDSIMSIFQNTAQWSTSFWSIVRAVCVSVPIHLIIICVLWLVFTAFSSIAISTVNHADSRASLASLDSNPSTTEKSSEKTDNCEKVGLPFQTCSAH